MPVRPPMFRPQARSKRQVDRDRGTSRERGYGAEWDKASRAFRRANPFCQYCEAGVFGEPRVAPADLVDHLYPHKGVRWAFWFVGWWVACCTPCHSGPKQSLERQGRTALDALAARLARPTWREGEGQS